MLNKEEALVINGEMTISEIYQWLKNENLLKSRQNSIFAGRYDLKVFYEYHRVHSHNIDSCMGLHEEVWDLVKEG